MEVYFCRKSVGSIDSSQISTLGDLIIKVIDLAKIKYPKINCVSGKEIIDTLPPHSNWSFLLLGRRERYITSFSLVQIDQKKDVGLKSPVYRSIGDKNIPDISYNSTEKIFFFHRLPDWHKSTCFDKTQNDILGSHHQYLKTKDLAFRTENQNLRQNLARQIRAFIVPTPDDDEVVISSIPPAISPAIHQIKEPEPPAKVQQVSTPSALPEFGGALPGFMSAPAPTPAPAPAPALNQTIPVKKTNHSIIDTLIDPLEIMNPSSEPEDKDHIDDPKLDQAIKKINTAQEKEDYQMAQALHFQINNTPPPVADAGGVALQRLIEKGIAVNALTGQ